MIFPPCADFRLTFAFRVDRHADPAVPDGDVLWQPGKPDGHKQVAGGAGKVDDLQKIDDPKPPLRNKREDGGKQNAKGQNWGQGNGQVAAFVVIVVAACKGVQSGEAVPDLFGAERLHDNAVDQLVQKQISEDEDAQHQKPQADGQVVRPGEQ